jgi:hypothetical protein
MNHDENAFKNGVWSLEVDGIHLDSVFIRLKRVPPKE